MRFWEKPCRKKFNKYEWNHFYPWWPRKIILSPKLVPDEYEAPYHWVCFEWVERKYDATGRLPAFKFYHYKHLGQEDPNA